MTTLIRSGESQAKKEHPYFPLGNPRNNLDLTKGVRDHSYISYVCGCCSENHPATTELLKKNCQRNQYIILPAVYYESSQLNIYSDKWTLHISFSLIVCPKRYPPCMFMMVEAVLISYLNSMICGQQFRPPTAELILSLLRHNVFHSLNALWQYFKQMILA